MKRRMIAVFFLIVALIMGLPQVASAAGPWYVSTTGNDSNDCLTELTACLTIQAAINKASWGDTIHVAAGTFTEHITNGNVLGNTPADYGKQLNLVGTKDIAGTPITEIQGSLSINMTGPDDGWSIENIKFVVTTKDLFTIKDAQGLTIKNCVFDGSGLFLSGKNGVNHVSGPNGNTDITIEGSTFKNGLYVAINSRITNLTVKNCTIENVKGGINQMGGNNLKVENTNISVIAQAASSDTYGVRFSSDATENLTITGGSISVNKNGLVADPGTYHSAIVIRALAAGTLKAEGASISGEVVNLSPTALDASPNWWGSTGGPAAGIIRELSTGDISYIPWCTNLGCTTFGAPVVNTTRGTYFATIQAAIDDAVTQNGDTISVAAGTYNENVVINKHLTLSGAGVTTIIQPPSAPASGYGIEIMEEGSGPSASDHTIIKDLRVTGAYNAVQFHHYCNDPPCSDTISHITLQNLTCDHNISAGYPTVPGAYYGDEGDGVHFEKYTRYSDVVINNLTATDNAGFGIDSGSGVGSIDGLTVTGGYFARNVYPGLEISTPSANNIIINGGAFFESNGIGFDVEGDIVLTGFNGNLSITDITVTGSGASTGIRITGNSSPQAPAGIMSLSNVTINGTQATCAPTNPWGAYPSAAIVLSRYTDVSNVHFTNVKLTSTAPAGLFLGTIYQAAPIPTLDLTGITFNGTYGQLIAVGRHGNNPAYAQANADVDARSAVFTGLTDNFAIEDKITHKLDNAALGLVTWVASNDYVTPLSGSIQRGIDAINSGGTVNVKAGLYAERVSIPKAVTLLGATAGVSKKNYVVPVDYAYDPNVESIIKPATDAAVPVIDVEKVGGGDIAGHITIRGFVLTDQGAVDNNAARGLINLNISTGLPDGILIEDNVIGPHTGLAQNGLKGRGGIASEGPSNVSRKNMVIKDNLIFDNLGDGVGIMLVGAYLSKGSTQDYSGARVENNMISGNTRSGIEIAGGVNGSVADPFVITNNTIKDSGWKIGYGLADYATKLKYGNGINFIRGGGETDSQNNRTPVVPLDPLYPFSSPTYVSITGNEITHNEKNGIYMGPMPQHITVAGNTIQSNGTGGGSYQTWDGIRIDLEENYYGVPGSRPYTLPLVLDKFTGNVFNNNVIMANGSYGVRVIQTPTLGPVDATNNFWGDPTGPLDSAGTNECLPCNTDPALDKNLNGLGNAVSDNVDYCPWAEYVPPDVDLQAVVDASCGGTVYLGPYTYSGGIVIHCGLTIKGVAGTIITYGSHGMTVASDDVTLDGITYDGGGGGAGDCGIWVNTGISRLWVRNCEIKNWPDDGMHFAGAVTDLKLIDNYVHNNAGDGIEFNGTPGGTVQIYGDTFRNNTGYGINAASGSVTAEYNEWGHIDGAAAGDGINGTVDADPWVFGKVYADVVPVPPEVRELETINVDIKTDTHELYGAQMALTFDPSLLEVMSYTTSGVGYFEGSDPSTVSYNNTTGALSYRCTRSLSDAPVSAVGVILVRITFRAREIAGTSTGATIDVTTSSVKLSAVGGVNIFVNSVTDDSLTILGTTTVQGVVDLQGRDNDSGALVDPSTGGTYGYNPAPVTTGSWGTYSFSNMTDDTYTFTIEMARYLDASAVVVVGGDTKTLNKVVLLGGDATDDDHIDISDAGIIGGQFGRSGGGITDTRADINNDNMVDILDLVLMGGNYEKLISPWTP
jgi:hypothetical protein